MGTYDPVRGCYRANHSKFSEKGSSDILGIWQGKMLCIEVKSRRGTLRPEQKEFLETMNRLGAITLVARSLDDVCSALVSIPDSLRTAYHPED
jgi:Holliday junction resolvase